MENFVRFFNIILILMLASIIFGIAGCTKTDENGQTVGQKVDAAIDRTNAQADAAGKKLEAEAGQLKDKIKQEAQSDAEKVTQAGRDVERQTRDAAAKAREPGGEVTSVVDDSAITASVKADILKDPDLSVLKVEVSTDKGEVTLRGKVDNETAKKRAEEVAANVSGVHKVHNELQVAAIDRRTGAGSA